MWLRAEFVYDEVVLHTSYNASRKKIRITDRNTQWVACPNCRLKLNCTSSVNSVTSGAINDRHTICFTGRVRAFEHDCFETRSRSIIGNSRDIEYVVSKIASKLSRIRYFRAGTEAEHRPVQLENQNRALFIGNYF